MTENDTGPRMVCKLWWGEGISRTLRCLNGGGVTQVSSATACLTPVAARSDTFPRLGDKLWKFPATQNCAPTRPGVVIVFNETVVNRCIEWSKLEIIDSVRTEYGLM